MKTLLFLGFLIVSNTWGITISQSPKNPRFDEEIGIQITHLIADSKYRLTLRSEKNANGQWKSSATFMSSDTGILDLTSARALTGSYKGVDAMGLFWSLSWTPNFGTHNPDFSLLSNLRLVVKDDEGKTVAQSIVSRIACLNDATISRVEWNKGEIFATFFYPKQSKKNPTVVVLGGSDGGKNEYTACMLARHGFTTIALAYFSFGTLPTQLVEIPLEYFEKALSIFRTSPLVDKHRIGITGTSKGGELSLLLGSRMSEFKAVAANAPSGIVWSGIDKTGGAIKSSWSESGKGLPFATFDPSGISFKSPPVSLRSGYEKPLGSPVIIKEATIPVEKTNGPVMLISGTDDQMWPSTNFSDMVVARLIAKEFKHKVFHLRYSGAGHWINTAYSPATVKIFGNWSLGGNPVDNAAASKDSWPKMIQFFRDYL